MEPVSIAIGLASLIGKSDWFQKKVGKSKGFAVADKVINFATDVTGATSPQEALEKLKTDQAAREQFRIKVEDNEHELEMAAYADRQSAREMYIHHPEQADKIANMIFLWNIPAICILVLLNVLLIIFPEVVGDAGLLVGNIIGIAVKSFFDERKEVCGFYFGGSMHNNMESRE